MNDKEDIPYDKLFEGVTAGSKILLEGRPGCGKTTLMRKISKDWSRGSILKNIELLLLVHLRVLLNNEDITLQGLLELVLPGFPLQEITLYIQRNVGKGICFALDGLDEYSPGVQKQNFVQKLVKGDIFPNAVVLVSSRPSATSRLKRNPHIIRRVEVLGFLKAQIYEYIENYYSEQPEKVEALKRFLEHHPNIKHMCYLPIHVSMVTYLFDQMGTALPETETEIYRQFTFHTLQRAKQKSSCEGILPVTIANLEGSEQRQFTSICRLAFEATVQSRQIFSHADVKSYFPCDHEKKEEACLGLITIDHLYATYGAGMEETYSFLHLTFQEFLATYHITRMTREEVLKELDEHGDKPYMQVVSKFLCGLTMCVGGDVQTVVQKIIERTPSNQLMHFQCSFESRNKAACELVIASAGGSVHLEDEFLNPAECSAVGYTVRQARDSVTEMKIVNSGVSREGLEALLKEVGEHSLPVKVMRYAKIHSLTV